jgi:hypothetical protein
VNKQVDKNSTTTDNINLNINTEAKTKLNEGNSSVNDNLIKEDSKETKHNRQTSHVEAKNLNSEKLSSSVFGNTQAIKEEPKINKLPTNNTQLKKSNINTNTTSNLQNKSTKEAPKVSTTQNSKISFFSDEDPTQNKVTTNSNSYTNNLTESSNNLEKKNPDISFKMDPNSSDIKDMKINVNMDADAAVNFFQTNKKYLPTTQQIVSGAKSTGNFIEKNAANISRVEGEISKETVVTGGKTTAKKSGDPLSNLFGLGKKG